MAQRETSARINEIAADWAVRVDDASLTAPEQSELEGWLSSDDRHFGAYARACAALSHSRRARSLGPDFRPDDYLSASFEPKVSDEVTSAEQPHTRRRFLTGGAAIAAIAAGGLGISWQAAAHTYRTGLGEVRRVPLEDGTSITLNTASEIKVSYTDNRRQIVLVTGEVLCQVTVDADRPFEVRAGDTRIRSNGGSFTVCKIAKAPLEVVVKQGAVDLDRPMQHMRPQRVHANMRVIAPENSKIETATLSPTEVGHELAWQDGMLWFEDTPLQQAAEEFGRYNEMSIRFRLNSAIAAETVTGLFSANDPGGFARAAALSLDLKTVPVSDGILLRR